MRKWWYRRIMVMFLTLSMVLGLGFEMEQIQAKANEWWIRSGSSNQTKVILGGMPIGIYMEMDGVMVLDTEAIKGMNGQKREPAKNLLREGDYIVAMNGKTIENKEQLVRAVEDLKSSECVIGVRRNGEEIQVKLKAVEVEANQYKLGVWVKDNIQGLGTITYLTTDNHFAALGHGIHDSDTQELIEISNGISYRAVITGVTKSVKGEPGGLEGMIFYNQYSQLGTIDANTENGIYGTVNDISSLTQNAELVEICPKRDIKVGKATIRCTIDNEVKEYEIKIKNVDYYTANVNKGILIEIVDPELLKETGGIVQGMSGSPIIQNGKIVGAVTHVLVNDPTRGYGIFIENMLEAVE